MSDLAPNIIGFLPHRSALGKQTEMYEGKELSLELRTGLTVLVGPNAAGKTNTLRALRDKLRQVGLQGKYVVYLTAGRSGPFEPFRTGSTSPEFNSNPASIGYLSWMPHWWQIEGATGMFLRLKARPDLLLKIQARLQGLHERRLRLEWTQTGLQISFLPTTGGSPYFANVEASGLLQLIPLLAALYDDEIHTLLIDEPEISLHPQLQSFLLREILECAGDPGVDKTKKIIVIATHSPSMLPIRRADDIKMLVFYADRQNLPTQVPTDAGELRNRKLTALVARLSENHKLAFFARNVLLLEGPSDEIIVGAISLGLKHSLLAANTQTVPVTGKGQFAETIKLFRLMQKNVFILGDLDLIADDSQVILSFQAAANAFVNSHGIATLAEMDSRIRQAFNTLIDEAWEDIQSIASDHEYWSGSDEPEIKAKRRAGLAVLLTADVQWLGELPRGNEWISVRQRYNTLLDVLEKAGCIILRKGTIEDYYLSFDEVSALGKPEYAAIEAEKIGSLDERGIRASYGDVVRAIEISAPIKKMNENALLREQLGSLLGAALLAVTPEMTDDELNARAQANFSSDTPIFKFANRTQQDGKGGYVRNIQIDISSSLFPRDGIPFTISEKENLTAVIENKLP